MEKVENPKYKLVRAGRRLIHRTETKCRFYRLQALLDIPDHGVKAGDLGGYVTEKNALSHLGSCWIGGEAQVIGHVTIKENAYITDYAVVNNPNVHHYDLIITNNVKISERATVMATKTLKSSSIVDYVHIYGDAYVNEVYSISGTTEIYGNAYIDKARYMANSNISDNSRVGENADLSQAAISGNSQIGESVNIKYSVISGDSFIGKNNKFEYKVFHNERVEPETHGVPKIIKYVAPDIEAVLKTAADMALKETQMTDSPPSSLTVASKAVIANYEQVCERINSYETDIVKIIKYPVMVDKTDPFTLDLTVALNTAKRFALEPESNEFADAVSALEKAFIMAESNARKIASSLLSDAEKRKTFKAKDLFRIASNEASSEQEKKVSFVQGFKALEGVLDIPDVAVDTFRLKIGLPELEM
jgi:UDP-3-O-[3-hydroxymyristoyl] glucosamine N-acyltransferase